MNTDQFYLFVYCESMFENVRKESEALRP